MPDASSLIDPNKVTLGDNNEHTLTVPDDARGLMLWFFAAAGTLDFRTTIASSTKILRLPPNVWTIFKDVNIGGRDWSYQNVGGSGNDILYYVYFLGEGN